MRREPNKQIRRGTLETYIDILRVLKLRGPLLKTKVMHLANVRCNRLTSYFEFLIARDLVQETWQFSKGKMRYQVTRRGCALLNDLRGYLGVIRPYEKYVIA